MEKIAVVCFEKGLTALEKFCKAGGWESTDQFMKEALISEDDAEEMHWLVDGDDSRQEDVTGLPQTRIKSIAVAGRRYYNEEVDGYLNPADGSVFVSEDEFEAHFS